MLRSTRAHARSLWNVYSQLTSPPRRPLTRPGRHSTALNPPSPAEAFQQLLPIVGFSVLTVMWVLSPKSVMLEGGGKLVEFALVVCESAYSCPLSHPPGCALTRLLWCGLAGFLFGQLSSKIILAHLTKGLFPFSWPLLIPLAIPAIAVNTPYLGLSVESRFAIGILRTDSLARSPSLLPPTLEALYLHLLLTLSLLSYTLSAHAVLSSFCGYLGISCLTIPFPNKAVEGWVPLPTVKLHQSPRPPSMGEYGAQEEVETYTPASAAGRAPLALDRVRRWLDSAASSSSRGDGSSLGVNGDAGGGGRKRSNTSEREREVGLSGSGGGAGAPSPLGAGGAGGAAGQAARIAGSPRKGGRA